MGREAPIDRQRGWFVGEDKPLKWNIKNGDAAVDVTGYTTQFKMADQQGGTTVLTKNGTVTNAAAGEITVNSVAADTIGIVPGTYWYALSRVDAGSNTVLAYGYVLLQARVL